jgi:hypothetical protein
MPHGVHEEPGPHCHTSPGTWTDSLMTVLVAPSSCCLICSLTSNIYCLCPPLPFHCHSDCASQFQKTLTAACQHPQYNGNKYMCEPDHCTCLHLKEHIVRQPAVTSPPPPHFCHHILQRLLPLLLLPPPRRPPLPLPATAGASCCLLFFCLPLPPGPPGP